VQQKPYIFVSCMLHIRVHITYTTLIHNLKHRTPTNKRSTVIPHTYTHTHSYHTRSFTHSYLIHYTFTQPATQNAHEQAQQSHSHHIQPPPHTQTNTHTDSYIIYITHITVSFPSLTHTTCNREGPRTSATKSRPRALASSFSRAGFKKKYPKKRHLFSHSIVSIQ